MDASVMSTGSKTKSRREMFEEQLKELQSDISNLSNKLSVPSMVTTNRINAMRGTTTSNLSATTTSLNDTTRINDRSYLSTSSNHSGQNIMQMPSSTNLSTQDLQFQQSRFDLLATELKDTLRQRDDAQRALEQLKSENSELRRQLSDYTHTKASYDALRQEFETMKITLESCERIRLQQKELIEVLQRSQAMLGVTATAGLGASLGVQSDAQSVMSFNSMSSISHTANTAAAAVSSNMRHLDDTASQTSSVLPTVLQHLHSTLPSGHSHRKAHGTHSSPVSANSSVSSRQSARGGAQPNVSPSQEHRDWLNVSAHTFRNEKARSRSAGRPPRASSSQGASSPAIPKRRAVTPTPSSTGKHVVLKEHCVSGFVPQYTSSSASTPATAAAAASQHATQHFQNSSFHSAEHSMLSHASQLYGYYPHETSILSTAPSLPVQQQSPFIYSKTNPQHALSHQPQTSATSTQPVSDPHHTSTLLTSLLLNQSPVRVASATATTPATKKSSTKKKLTRKTTSAPAGNSKSSGGSRHSTHITPSSSSSTPHRPSASSTTTTSTATKKKKKSTASPEPLVHEGTGVRILYRPKPSPVATFSKAKRM